MHQNSWRGETRSRTTTHTIAEDMSRNSGRGGRTLWRDGGEGDHCAIYKKASREKHSIGTLTQYYCPFGAAPILCALVHTADCHHRLTDCTSQLSEN
eukprot:m.26550 g.26550  ORF g.26550 m.26550 type:complete len:97 (-) comp6328_c0_seq1:64-354(-)